MNVLVTGGAGYIGTHTIIELQHAGHTVTVVDDLSNSSPEAIKRVEAITNKSVSLHVFDVQDQHKLDELFAGQVFDAVIHFAGLKAVGESTQQPVRYYQTNLGSTLALLDVMAKHDVKRLIFSSSATVYGDPAQLPITEESPVGIGLTNPYGKTKYFIEEILSDLSTSDPDWSCLVLRYFNPIGAHPSGTIGEDPLGVPNNLFPYIAQVAVGKRAELTVHGNDYDTADGTGVRDYIHVVDLAKGHV
ncbi:MAG: UDP-glucose 4-epimerase GalE, partial [Candidatus Saccharimonadales bacterium]